MILQRGPSTKWGTFGRLGEFFTLERPWADNARGISSIPAGDYRCEMTWSPRFRRMVFLVLGVQGRTGIRIHPANLASQLNGCIALGEKLGTLGGVPAVLLSQPAVRRFEETMRGQPFILEVRDAGTTRDHS
jgi:hypothetical protein